MAPLDFTNINVPNIYIYMYVFMYVCMGKLYVCMYHLKMKIEAGCKGLWDVQQLKLKPTSSLFLYHKIHS